MEMQKKRKMNTKSDAASPDDDDDDDGNGGGGIGGRNVLSNNKHIEGSILRNLKGRVHLLKDEHLHYSSSKGRRFCQCGESVNISCCLAEGDFSSCCNILPYHICAIHTVYKI